MITFIYNENGARVEKDFMSNIEAALFITRNDIKDEDFVSIQFGENSIPIEGIDGLKQAVLQAALSRDIAEIFAGGDFEDDEEDEPSSYKANIARCSQPDPLDEQECDWEEAAYDFYAVEFDEDDNNLYDEFTSEEDAIEYAWRNLEAGPTIYRVEMNADDEEIGEEIIDFDIPVGFVLSFTTDSGYKVYFADDDFVFSKNSDLITVYADYEYAEEDILEANSLFREIGNKDFRGSFTVEPIF